MSESRYNSSVLNSDIARARYTKNQDKAAISLFNHLLVEFLGLVSINDMKMYDLEDEVEKNLMGYYLYIQYTNIPKNHQACLANHNKDPTGYLKYALLSE